MQARIRESAPMCAQGRMHILVSVRCACARSCVVYVSSLSFEPARYASALAANPQLSTKVNLSHLT
eukprot:3731380-Pleurochrysis_carterae.AAC.1